MNERTPLNAIAGSGHDSGTTGADSLPDTTREVLPNDMADPRAAATGHGLVGAKYYPWSFLFRCPVRGDRLDERNDVNPRVEKDVLDAEVVQSRDKCFYSS